MYFKSFLKQETKEREEELFNNIERNIESYIREKTEHHLTQLNGISQYSTPHPKELFQQCLTLPKNQLIR